MMIKPIISFENVSYSYQNGREFSYKNLNFTISAGSITAILGMNGVGKTTLLLLMLGYLKPGSGEINTFEENENGYRQGMLKRISYLPQYENLPLHITVNEYILLGRVPYISPLALPTSEDLDIVNKHESILGIKHLGNIELGKISGGELQRVRICRALAQESEIILLDEPISHLDIKSKYAIMGTLKTLNEVGKTIIFSSHDPIEALRISDHSLLIYENHRILFGMTKDLLTTNNLSKCLDIPIEIIQTKNGPSYEVIDL